MPPTPAGLLTLRDITYWLGMPTSHRCMATRRLLERHHIQPAIRGKGRRPSLWAWEDLQPLAHTTPDNHDSCHTEP